MGVGAGGLFHFRVKIDPDKPESHPNIEPLCNRESERLTGEPSCGYMTDKKESVRCLACLMLLELQSQAAKPDFDYGFLSADEAMVFMQNGGRLISYRQDEAYWDGENFIIEFFIGDSLSGETDLFNFNYMQTFAAKP